MPKIKQLPAHEAQKIAAGEVVERPANVVKELIENALDAGATEITLYLEEGGKKLIRVVDNGCGMGSEDARLCILHHATSKISSVLDLERITTFGFRGEALSSIASVSRMIITTKEESAPLATRLEVLEGAIVKEVLVTANRGTDIAIHDIFFNVPARQKFLKTKETEWRTIVHLFQALCLAYQKVSFKLYHDERPIYTIGVADSLQGRISQLFEPALAKNIVLMQAQQERMNTRLMGAFTNASYTRFDRSHLFMFVNQRWVKNHKLSQALIKGFQNMLPQNRYPAGFLFIELDPTFVDINIHPRKEEVQFLHPRIIEDLIQETAQKTLEQTSSLVSQKKISSEPYKAAIHDLTSQDSKGPDGLYKEELYSTDNQLKNSAAIVSPDAQNSKPTEQVARAPYNETSNALHERFSKAQHKATHSSTADFREEVIDRNKEQYEFLNALTSEFSPAQVEKESIIQGNLLPGNDEYFQYRLIGQFQLTYILIENDEGLVLVDQHAAHERIMYEQLRNKFEEITQVRLLFPHVISLNREDVSLFEPFFELLAEFGIEAQSMSEREIVITQTPLFLKNQSLDDCVKQAIGVLHEYQYLDAAELKKIIHERVHALLSCKSAVKAGDELSIESMHELIRGLHATPNQLTCPHGRPTRWELKKGDIEKKFKRDYR